MIRAVFFKRHGRPLGFRVAGHSGVSAAGTDIVCAAVSSAAYLTANTITEVLGVKARVLVKDGEMLLEIPENDAAPCGSLLKGFRLHMAALGEQYPDHIEVIDTEV